MKRSGLIAAAAFAAAACSSGPGSFNGTVGGDKLTVQSSTATKEMDTSSGNIGGFWLAVGLSDQSNACKLLQSNTQVKNSTGFAVLLGTTDANGHLTTNVTTGTYDVQNALALLLGLPKSQSIAVGGFDQLNSTCASTFTNGNNLVNTGTVMLNSVNLAAGGSVSGTFDVTFVSGDHVKGSFDAPYCDTTAAQADGGTTPACQ